MSEPLHNRPVARDKLTAALKRNMARRKAGGSDVASLDSLGVRSGDGRREPEAEGRTRGGGSGGGTPPAPKAAL